MSATNAYSQWPTADELRQILGLARAFRSTLQTYETCWAGTVYAPSHFYTWWRLTHVLSHLTLILNPECPASADFYMCRHPWGWPITVNDAIVSLSRSTGTVITAFDAAACPETGRWTFSVMPNSDQHPQYDDDKGYIVFGNEWLAPSMSGVIAVVGEAVRLLEDVIAELNATDDEFDRTRAPSRPQSPQGTTSPGSVFVSTPLQAAILAALDGRGLTKQKLAEIVSGGEGSTLYRNNGIKELMDEGLVANKRGVGYYRPDKPPRHQSVTNAPPTND